MGPHDPPAGDGPRARQPGLPGPPVGQDAPWQRMHPLSPLVRGGLFVIGVLGYVVSQRVDDVIGSLVPSGSGPGADEPARRGGPDEGFEREISLAEHPLVAVGGLLAVLVGIVALGLASWWFSRYRIGESSLELRTGAIFRQHRQVRYDRIQSVDLRRSLLARLTGLAEVRVESAGGSDSHVSLAYLTLGQAEQTRDLLLGLAHAAAGPAGAPPARTSDGPGEPPGEPGARAARAQAVERPVLAVPPSRVVWSALLTPETFFVVAMLGIGAGMLLAGWGAALAGLAPVVLFSGVRPVKNLMTWWGFRVVQVGDTLKVHRGLTDVRTSSVPTRRVQAVELTQPWLWRRAGWWRVSVNVAGVSFGGDAGDGGADVLVPAGTAEEVLALVDTLAPGLDRGLAAEAMTARGASPGFVGAPRAARLFDPFAWRRVGYAITPSFVLTRGGWLGRRVQLVPHGRIQSLTLHQGPWDRRRGLASVLLVSTPGPVTPRVQHLAVADAAALVRDEGVRSALARAGQAPQPVGGFRAGCASARETVDYHDMDARTEGAPG